MLAVGVVSEEAVVQTEVGRVVWWRGEGERVVMMKSVGKCGWNERSCKLLFRSAEVKVRVSFERVEMKGAGR